jgi:hypothetical protein
MVENETRSISNSSVPSAANRAPRNLFPRRPRAAWDDFRTPLGWAIEKRRRINRGVELVDFEAVINRPNERR